MLVGSTGTFIGRSARMWVLVSARTGCCRMGHERGESEFERFLRERLELGKVYGSDQLDVLE